MSEYLILAKLLAGYPKEKLDLSQMNGLGDIIKAVIESKNKLETFESTVSKHPDANEIRQKVFAENPSDNPTKDIQEYQNEQITTMPNLPDYACLNPKQEEEATSCAIWLNKYISYASRRAPMLPKEFHESAGLWLLGLSVARRLKICMPHNDIYPNLFLLWIAPTTVYSKSTGLKIAQEIAEKTMPHLLLSNEFSPEGLFDELSGRPPTNLNELPEKHRDVWNKSRIFSSKRGLILDEASSLFTALKREHNAGLAEALMRFFDSTNHKGRTRGRGLTIVENSYLSFLGATTENGVKQADIKKLWESGLWPRFGLIVPKQKPKYIRHTDIPTLPSSIKEHLINISSKWLPTPNDTNYPPAQTISLGHGVFEAWHNYDKAIYKGILTNENITIKQELYGTYGRLPEQSLKIALCLALADWDGKNKPIIELHHYHRSQLICENWRENTHQLYWNLTGMTDKENMEQQIIRTITKTGKKGITIRNIYRRLRCKREEIEPIIYNLENDGIIQKFRQTTKSRTDSYRLGEYCDS